MHNGAFTSLEDAVRHHLDALELGAPVHAGRAGAAADLGGPPGPIEPVLARLDPLLATPIQLQRSRDRQLVAFVRDGLLDPRATPDAAAPARPAGRPERPAGVAIRISLTFFRG